MGKGARTRDEILGEALRQASTVGLEGLSIGGLARDIGMSKSGLFAHFGSKEELQQAILTRGADVFAQRVVRPAIRAPRGEPRVRAMFENWIVWTSKGDLPGGCLFVQSTAELDDRPGPVRDHLVNALGTWMQTLARAAAIAVEEGHFRADLDVDQFAFEAYGVMLAFHTRHRLFRDADSADRARRAFDRLIVSSR